MTRCLPPSDPRPAMYMMAMMTPNSSGTAIVERRNARPRICSRYSRRAMRAMLCIGFASHGLDEDLFKRGLDQLVAVDGGHGGGLVQQLLRIAVGLELDFRVAGEVLGFSDF